MSVTTADRMAREPIVDDAVAGEHLDEGELELLVSVLGRNPTYTELGIASALYSEHCSYKSSKAFLRSFPTSGDHVVQGPGENAGVVDIGDGWVAAFKMESHNHPSFIEPYQGAATGVGGILRDVFTMGARPIALLDSLRFGEIDAPRMRHLVDGVVRGIGDYGNCVGIPTVGGETGFHRSYNGNILVNAFALGICRKEQIFLASAEGVGNTILYAGSRTGRDGIHGATMASESFDAESEAKRPTVQVGDPFTEKVLLEACLEAMREGAVVGVQDMGAAGLTSSCFEMAARADTGFELDLHKVPLRERALTPYEIMLSESQERMVFVVERDKAEGIERILERWGLEAVPIGQVTATGRGVLRWEGEVVADMPVAPLVDKAPVYERPTRSRPTPEAPDVPGSEDPARDLLRLLSTPELGDKTWIYRQYDSTVRSNTVVGPGGDAAVLRLKGLESALALCSDVNPVYCALDPRTGGRQAVAEAARNLATVGSRPLALTDCLNFASPKNPEINWQLRECIEGMAEACRALEVPVISGNVSLYNETDGRPVHPTPTVAMVGLIPKLAALGTDGLGPHETLRGGFPRAGDTVLILGTDHAELGGSAYQRLICEAEEGLPPRVDLELERRLGELLRHTHGRGWVTSCHDVSDGGLAVSLAEACLTADVGLDARIDDGVAGLFSESQGRAVLSVVSTHVDDVLSAAESFAVPAAVVGTTGGSALSLRFDGGGIDLELEQIRDAWRGALPTALGV